jgi:hypothetical protein
MLRLQVRYGSISSGFGNKPHRTLKLAVSANIFSVTSEEWVLVDPHTNVAVGGTGA